MHVQAQFYGLLDEYLTSAAGADALNDVVLAANGTIVTSQLAFSHTASYNQVCTHKTIAKGCLPPGTGAQSE